MESILSRLQRLEARLDASAAMVPSPLLPIQSAAEDQQHGDFYQRMHGLNLVGSTPQHATFTSPSSWEPQVTRRGADRNGQPSTWDPGRHSASASVATAFTSPPPTVQHPPLPAQADTMRLPLGFRHPSQHSWRPPLPQQAPWPSNQQKLLVNPSLDAQCKLSKLSQVGSVLDYQIQFEKLSSRATETHERILVSLFISGLKHDIRWDLERNRPTALKEAFASARYQESRLEDIRLARNKVVEELADSDETREIEAGLDMKTEDELVSGVVKTEEEFVLDVDAMLEVGEVHACGSIKSSLPNIPLPIDGGIIEGTSAATRINSSISWLALRLQRYPVTTAFQKSSSQRRKMWYQDELWIDSSYQMCKLISGLFVPNVARGRIDLKFYALEEVYKDF